MPERTTKRDLIGWDPSAPSGSSRRNRMDIPAGTVVEATPYPKVTNLLEVVFGDGTHAYAWEFQLEPVGEA